MSASWAAAGASSLVAVPPGEHRSGVLALESRAGRDRMARAMSRYGGVWLFLRRSSLPNAPSYLSQKLDRGAAGQPTDGATTQPSRWGASRAPILYKGGIVQQPRVAWWNNEDTQALNRITDKEIEWIGFEVGIRPRPPRRPRRPFVERDYVMAYTFTVLGMSIMALAVVVMGGRLW